MDKYGIFIKDADLTNYNTYGIHTSSKYLIKVNSIDNLVKLIKYLKNENIKYYILGKGSNVILPDTKSDGVIISLELLNEIKIDGNIAYADAGVVLSSFIMMLINNNLGGLESLCGIPGTLGGALYGNAGVKDVCIYDYLVNILVIRDNKLISLEKKDILYSYRDTEFKRNNDIIVGASFKLEENNKEEMLNIVKENRLKRQKSQPFEYKNAGSVFKNPENDYAGRLIEMAGLKGYSVNDAEVSEKHANFIINKGMATSIDIRTLIAHIQKEVYNKFEVELELEQIVIDW